MNFREFVFLEENQNNLSNFDVANMYFNGRETIRSLSKNISKSIPEIYRIIHSFGKPNRRVIKHDVVKSLSDSGMHPNKISNLTGYSKRHILNIIKK